MYSQRTLVALKAFAAIAPFVPFAPFLPLTSAAHAQDQLWVTQFGTFVDDDARAVTSDGRGNVFVLGTTKGALGGPNAGGKDIFLAQYSGTGRERWIVQFGTDQDEGVGALVSDDAGGVFVVGSTQGSLGGPISSPLDVFMAHYDSSGRQSWIRQFGTNSVVSANGIVSDGSSGLFVCGSTLGSMGGPNMGEWDGYVAHYDTAGNQTWARQFGTANRDFAAAIASDGSGGVYVAGMIDEFFSNPSPVYGDVFVAHYDGGGNQSWLRRFGSANNDFAFALAPDGSGGVFVGGQMNATFPGLLTSQSDAFLAHYNRNGEQSWLRRFGSLDGDSARSLSPDGSGGVYVGGGTKGNLAGPNAGDADGFIAHFDDEGNQIWALQIGTGNYDMVNGLSLEKSGDLFACGSTAGDLGGFIGGLDAFVALYRETPCYADCDGNGTLDIFDFLCFQNSFVSGEPYACDCDPDPVCDIFDFLCFQNAFVGGCP